MSDFLEDVNDSVVEGLIAGIKAWAPGPDVRNVTHSASYDQGIEIAVRLTLKYLNDEDL